MMQDPNAPLLKELHWFIQQRWRAGLIVTLGVLLSTLWMDWDLQHAELLGTGLVILLYNLAFWFIFKAYPRWLESPAAQRGVAWAQVTLDLACLTALTIFTGGVVSPLLGMFVLHMIFASLLLQPPKYASYLAWIMAISMMAAALWIGGQWPDSSTAWIFTAGWATTLFMTVYFTSHITGNMHANYDHTRSILDTAADAVLSITATGFIERGNPAALKMFGYTSKQMIGKNIDKLVPLDNAAQTNSNGLATAHPALVTDSEYTGERHDGSTFPIEITTSKLEPSGPQAYTTIIRDITDRHRTEATLRSLNDELKRHQDQLVQHEKMVAVGQMAAGVAHEIANPLANMDSLIQLVERNPDRLRSDSPQLLREQVTRINHIARQLKDFAHPSECERRSIPADELLQSALDLIRFDRRHHLVKFDQQLLSPCCNVFVHPQSIQQVLVNVIVNAFDAVADAKNPRVTIGSKCLSDGVCQITIDDNGTGIPPEKLEQIFEPFYTTKPLGQGTGLGLSISFNLVRRDDGQITVKSTPRVGTTFSICLPVANAKC